MNVFATNFLENQDENVDGGKKWSWTPVTAAKGTGPGRPTNTNTITRSGNDSNLDNDTANESTNSANGAMIA